MLNTKYTEVSPQGRVGGVRMVEMVVPSQVMLGEKAVLECRSATFGWVGVSHLITISILNIIFVIMMMVRFDMEGEELYSVKWYKAGHEFYRYIPGDRSAAPAMK